jgi:hypothetical protein
MIDSLSSTAPSAVFALLGDPATYGAVAAGNAVRRYETHAAIVFLAGDRALKIKRAVRYPFRDVFLFEFLGALQERKVICFVGGNNTQPHRGSAGEIAVNIAAQSLTT